MVNIFSNFTQNFKNLNIKKVIIVSLIIVTIILLIICMFFYKKKSKKHNYSNVIYNSETNTTTFLDKNHSVQLELSNIYELKNFSTKENYLLELRSDQNLNIFLSSKEKFESKSLKDVAEADKLAYIQNFNSTSNLSDIKEININGFPGCTYSFHYLDETLNTTFYLQISWLEFDNNYYVFDIEFPLNNLNDYTNIVLDTLSNFSKYN